MRRTLLKATAGTAWLAVSTGGTVRAAAVPAAHAAHPVVRTASGRVRGVSQGGVNRFLGIPYAQDIGGRNRFARPQPVKPWQGVRDAFRYADSCPQQDTGVVGPTPVSPAFQTPSYVHVGDNCLALNVWTPTDTRHSHPVMVWLHGGGWVSGSGSCAIYDGERLAGGHDVTVVTLNHRLGASGLTDLSRVLGGDFADASNLGIRDIVAALEWVRDNIAAFGGDPDRVTIFGESGGGWKVSTMLGVPAAKGLFHRAVIESGPLTRFLQPGQADDVARKVLRALDVTPDTAEKLHTISTKDVIRAEARVLADSPMSMQVPGFPSSFWPVLDGDFIRANVFDPRAVPSSLDVPLLIGQNGTEFTLFMLGDKAAYTLDAAQLERRVAHLFGDNAALDILHTYRRDFPDYDPSSLWFRIFSDYGMGVLSSHIMDLRAVPGAAPVYAYRFDWQSPILAGKLYSPHTIEIPFVFDNVVTQAGGVMTGGGREAATLAQTVASAWATFARTGVPRAEGLPDWPAFSSADRASMHIDTVSRIGPYMDQDMLELFHAKLWKQAGLA
nr:carboxylesterase family protein [Oleiagrimonas sp. C23AA]